MGAEPGDAFAVHEDADPRAASHAWAYAEVAGGREPEAVAAELEAAGWAAEDAAAIAEKARQQSRHRRGVATRADVARAADARYRSGMAANPLVGGGGLFGVLGSLCRAVANLFAARKPPPGRPPSRR